MKKITAIINPDIIPFLILFEKEGSRYYQLGQLLWFLNESGIKENYYISDNYNYYHSVNNLKINYDGLFLELNFDRTFRKRNSFSQECPEGLLNIPIFIERT